ncbi:unnamed protein product [Paramecium octaurelia]|uniref:Zinc finger PHD-type domain-containing protein n=1 Tax=Paramecium octaurelia TaxID=43137 RepID=A0A8S1V4S4_PAROT|nr:unnamed protein product [Paramecium octaurelia]
MAQLTQEVIRSLKQNKELDEKVTINQSNPNKLQKQNQQQQQQSQKKKQEIDQLYEESVNQSQAKMIITGKAADNAVQQLDNDLKKQEENLKTSTATDHKRGFFTLSKQEKEKRKKINQEIELSKEIFQNAIQNEPLYCKCQKPSFGSMVMCDNQQCSKQWFHLECVKLKEFPPQKEPWFCSSKCRKEGKGDLQK